MRFGPGWCYKPVLESALFLSAHLDQSGRSTQIACFFQALFESLDQACQPLDQACRCLYIAHLSRTCSTLISSTEYKSFGFPAYARRCIDMLALMSHRRAVCRGNLVFCATHRNLSVHRPNTNHSDSLHTSDGALICLQS